MASKHVFDAGTTLPELERSVNPTILLLAIWQSTTLRAIGFPDTIISAKQPRHEWPDETLGGDESALANAETTGSTAFEVATGEGGRFAANDLVQVDGAEEVMRVSSVATDTLTVVRSFGGTTAEAYTAGQTLIRFSRLVLDGATVTSGTPTQRALRDNFVQTFDRTVQVDDTFEASDIIGVEDELNHQAVNAERDLMRDIAKTFWRGIRQSANPEGNLTTQRTMDGLVQQILNGTNPSTEDAVTGVITETLINNLLQTLFEKGVQPSDVVIASGARQHRNMSNLLQSRIRLQPDSGMVGANATIFLSDYGPIPILEPDRFVPTDTIAVIEPSKLKMAQLENFDGDPFRRTRLAKTGHNELMLVDARLTLEARNASDGGHGIIFNLGN